MACELLGSDRKCCGACLKPFGGSLQALLRRLLELRSACCRIDRSAKC